MRRLKLPLQTFLILFVIGGVLVFLGSLLYSKTSYSYERDRLAVKIATASVRLSRAMIPSATKGDMAAIKPILSAFAGTPEVTCVTLNLKKKKISEHWPNAECVAENPGLFLHKQPIRRGVRVLGEVSISFTDDFINQEIEDMITAIALGIAVLLSTLLIATLAAQQFLVIRPISIIIEALNALQRGTADHRIKNLDATPEISSIAIKFNEMASDLEEKDKVLFERSNELALNNKRLEVEKEKLERIMLNTFPKITIDEISKSGNVIPKKFSQVGLLFADLVGFTKISSAFETQVLFKELNEIFTAFDEIVRHHSGERIKTSGDAYFAITGANYPCSDTAGSIAYIACGIRDFMQFRNQNAPAKWEVRIGVHYGSVVGGVVGKTKFVYDVFGDSVNVCSRLETSSLPMRINGSKELVKAIPAHFETEERGAIQAKGKGKIEMFFIERKQIDPKLDFEKIMEISRQRLNIFG